MGGFKALFLVSGAVVAMASLAHAADLPPPPAVEPGPMMAPPDFSGWYLRGDIGFGVQTGSINPVVTPNPLIGAPANAFNSFYNSSLSTQGMFDAGIGYRTRIFSNKIPMSIQLNARDLERPGYKLQPIADFPDGTPNSYRILDPTLYILQVSFDL